MSNTFELQSMDVSGIAKAPDLTFAIAEGGQSITCDAPGGHVLISKLPGLNDGQSQVELRNTLTGEVFANILVQHTPAASVDDPWNDEAVYVCEVAAALYWSMWRMQQIKAARS